MFLTESQKRALILLDSGAFHLVREVTRKCEWDGNKWVYERDDVGLEWIRGKDTKYTPSKHKMGNYESYPNDSTYTHHTLGWKVAGELQNKGLCSTRIDISNRSLHCEITDLGRIEASKLGA